jgi:Flp pilus assembly protein TadD
MQAVTQYNPRNWAAYWIEGKAYQALDDPQAANRSFETAYGLHPSHPDVAREYAHSCLALGHFEEAIDATRHAIALAPDDAGLQANLALAYLLAGQNQDAARTISVSLSMNPTDKISQRLKQVIDDVLSGQRAQPRTLAEITPH